MKLFAVHDTKGGFFLPPFTESSTVAALRGFEVAVNDGKAIFSRFPDDFALVELASFDQVTGELVPLSSPQNLGTARTVLKSPPTQTSFESMKLSDMKAPQ